PDHPAITASVGLSCSTRSSAALISLHPSRLQPGHKPGGSNLHTADYWDPGPRSVRSSRFLPKAGAALDSDCHLLPIPGLAVRHLVRADIPSITSALVRRGGLPCWCMAGWACTDIR